MLNYIFLLNHEDDLTLYFIPLHWIDAEFKNWKELPYTTPHGLSENAKKKIEHGFSDQKLGFSRKWLVLTGFSQIWEVDTDIMKTAQPDLLNEEKIKWD